VDQRFTVGDELSAGNVIN